MKRVTLVLLLITFSVVLAFSMGAPPAGAYGRSSAPAGSAIMSFFPLIIVYVLIGLYVRHDNKKMRETGSIFSYKQNKESVYVEYRQWKILWGLMIDSQKEVNLAIDEWNNSGYTCIGFQRSFLPNVSILKILIIVFITIITLGFVNFYTGPTLLFLQSGSLRNKNSDETGEPMIKLNKALNEK